MAALKWITLGDGPNWIIDWRMAKACWPDSFLKRSATWLFKKTNKSNDTKSPRQKKNAKLNCSFQKTYSSSHVRVWPGCKSWASSTSVSGLTSWWQRCSPRARLHQLVPNLSLENSHISPKQTQKSLSEKLCKESKWIMCHTFSCIEWCPVESPACSLHAWMQWQLPHLRALLSNPSKTLQSRQRYLG